MNRLQSTQEKILQALERFNVGGSLAIIDAAREVDDIMDSK
jgi:hypothetical protein